MAIGFPYKESKEKDQFDQYGNIISTIRLVKIDDFSACKFETEQEEDDFIAKSREAGNEIVLSRDNIPTRMWWYNSSKGLVEIHW